jgi:hypothetical protein
VTRRSKRPFPVHSQNLDFVKPRADGDGFDADVEAVAGFYLGTYQRRLVGWSQHLVKIRKSLGLNVDGDDGTKNTGRRSCHRVGPNIASALL